MVSWIDFSSIKQTAPLLRVLERYQITGLRRSGKDHWRGVCPLHGGPGRDAFHVNTNKQLFHCFSCGAGGTVLDLVAALERCTLREAGQRLAAWWNVPVTPWQEPVVQRQATVTEKREALRPLGFRLRGVDGRHPYLGSRGIAELTAALFGIGFYDGPGLLSRRLVIPIHDEAGQLVAYCGRSLDGTEPRYKFPAGFAKSEIVFNLHRASTAGAETGIVGIVVEGFFDCLKVYQAGFDSVMALMGAALYDPQRRLLSERFQRLILMLDGDPAGRRASDAIAAQLVRHCPVKVIELAANVQPDQLPAQTIRAILTKEGGKPQSR